MVLLQQRQQQQLLLMACHGGVRAGSSTVEALLRGICPISHATALWSSSTTQEAFSWSRALDCSSKQQTLRTDSITSQCGVACWNHGLRGLRCRSQHTLPAAVAFQQGQQRGFAASGLPQRAGSSSSGGAAAYSDSSSEDPQLQARAVTRLITLAQDLAQLQQIVQQHGSNFNAIHAAAAFAQAAKLAGSSSTSSASAGDGANSSAQPLLELLLPIWTAALPQASPREVASVAHACTKLTCTDEQLWSSTVAAFMQQGFLQQANARDLSILAYSLATAAGSVGQPGSSSSGGSVPGVAAEQVQSILQAIAAQLAALLQQPAASAISCQSIANVLWAVAKLESSITAAQLVGFMNAMVQPRMLAAADDQSLASSLWAISQMQQLLAAQQRNGPQTRRQQSQAKEQQQQHEQEHIWHRLLGQEQLAKLAQGSPQAVSNTLLALSRLSSGPGHALSVPFAQQCAAQLLSGPTAQQLASWNARDIGSSMWACARLGLRDAHFFEHAAAAAPEWLPDAVAPVLSQAAWSFAKMRYKNTQFMEDIMQQGRHLMHRTHGHGLLLPDQAERTNLAATLSWAVAALHITQLAGDVKALIAASGIKQQEDSIAAADARMLWRVHGWLHHHQLLGGHGLSKLLTEQQLAACAEASRHTHRNSPPPHAVAKLQQKQQQQ